MVGHWGGWEFSQGAYWWLMGFDQFLHQLTNIALTAAFFVF
jgi:hypothetical protein